VITNPKFVGMYIEDQDRAKRFWTETVGWECPLDQPMGPGDDADRWIEVHPPAGGTYLVLFTPPEHRDRVGSFGPVWFDCDDLDGTYDELKAKGVEFESEPKVAEWDPTMRYATFVDSEGNRFGFSARG
jgi:predicted enzyme related to lactoylglutathione lyase